MVAIVDYRAGNLTSVRNAFAAIGAEAVVTSDPEVVARADRVVFPGVGAAGSAMESIRRMGLAGPVREAAASKPFLGICLGMQILFEHSEEDGGVDLLGILPGKVRRFPSVPGCKVPQIGWNQVVKVTPHPVTEHLADGEFFYFVHSYYAEPADPAEVLLRCEYMLPFAAAVGRRNLFATQFHPEKSQQAGLDLLRAFIGFCG